MYKAIRTGFYLSSGLLLGISLIQSAFMSYANAQVANDEAAVTNSSWVVSDAFALGKPRRNSVGASVVFFGGRLHFVENKGVESFQLRTVVNQQGETYELSRGDHVVGKMLAVKDAEGRLTLYVNHDLRGTKEIKVREAAKEKCVEMYVCLPLSDAEGLARLAKHGVAP